MKRYFMLCTAVLLILLMCSCANKESGKENNKNEAPLFQETISPNKDYVESDEDVLYYTVEVYQDEDNSIIVRTDSNSQFFKNVDYTLAYDKKIAESDIDVEWTTLMGNPVPSEDDQLAIAQITISQNSDMISQRKISFVNGAINIIEETLPR